MNRLQVALRQVALLVVALVVGGLFIVLAGYNPFAVYGELLAGAGFNLVLAIIPGNPAGISTNIAAGNLFATINVWGPLILLGLSAALPFRAGLFNVGSQGQYWFGAILGVQLGITIGSNGGLLAAFLGAIVGGAVCGAIAGALKALRGANEVVTTIMINWLVVYTGHFLYGYAGPFANPVTQQPVSVPFPEGMRLPELLKSGITLHAGILVALVAVAVFGVLMSRTGFGFSVRTLGSNRHAAHYAGMPTKRLTVLVMGIGGAFAGLAGFVEITGTTGQITGSNIVGSSSFAFAGIAVALLGRNSAVGVLLAALLFAALQSGSRFLSGSFPPELASSLSGVLQAVIVFLIGANSLFSYLGGLNGIAARLPIRKTQGAVE
ncbi:ABC transporter permease [Naasia lichenicola]|uniref:ABC transporter permease n=1 Tax=Naasia lichenicola TaxID=2565933 RepID=UPI00130E9E94|nr:ABC transporter permease [Naasia lichenicola]